MKEEVGPFIVNAREPLQEVDKRIKNLNLTQGESWFYDPHQIISKNNKSGIIPLWTLTKTKLNCFF